MMASRPEPLSGKDQKSFAFITIRDRLPDILTKVIDVFSRLSSSYYGRRKEEEAVDAKGIVTLLCQLKNEMQTDKAIRLLKDTYKDVSVWNDHINNLQILVKDQDLPSWYSVAWLSCESYMYRRIFEALQLSKFHTSFDPFFEQKSRSFFSSDLPMVTLARYVLKFFNTTQQQTGIDQLKPNFEMLLQYCLWGNKCDLSISAGSQVSNQLMESSQLKPLLEQIVSNHSESIWNHVMDLKTRKDGCIIRIDFVLDNAGFELYTDLCFAEFLLDKQFCDIIYFHVKDIPWFVSDTSRKDFEWTIAQCTESADSAIQELGKRWQNRLENNTFVIIENQFWTFPHDFALMKTADPNLYNLLSESDFLIFKGDLNYRKLIGDRNWPHTTKFSEALNGFCPVSLCALRTLKADLVVGLNHDQDIELSAKHNDWMVSGQYAVIQYCKGL